MLRELEPEDAETERMLRNSFRWQYLTFALLLGVLVLVFVQPHSSGIKPLLMIAVAVSFYTGLKVSHADGAVTSRYFLDSQNRRWRFSLVNLLLFGLIGVHHVLEFPATHEILALAIGIAFLLAPSGALVMGPKADIEEEITRTLRGRALRVGYVTALLALTGATLVAIYWPAASLPALAWGLFAASAVPVVTYAALDCLSDRDG